MSNRFVAHGPRTIRCLNERLRIDPDWFTQLSLLAKRLTVALKRVRDIDHNQQFGAICCAKEIMSKKIREITYGNCDANAGLVRRRRRRWARRGSGGGTVARIDSTHQSNFDYFYTLFERFMGRFVDASCYEYDNQACALNYTAVVSESFELRASMIKLAPDDHYFFSMVDILAMQYEGYDEDDDD